MLDRFDAWVLTWLRREADPERMDGPAFGAGPTWGVALVAAGAQGLDDFIAALRPRPLKTRLDRLTATEDAAHPDQLRAPRMAAPWVLSLAETPSGQQPRRQRIRAALEQLLLARGVPGPKHVRGRRVDPADADKRADKRAVRRERWRELLRMPPLHALGHAVLPLVLLTLVMTSTLLYGLIDVGDLRDLAGAPAREWPDRLGDMAGGCWDAWLGLGPLKALSWLLWPLIALWLWVRALNLSLPQPLHLRLPGEAQLLESFGAEALQAYAPWLRLLDKLPGAGRARALMASAERAARLRWLRHRLFGPAPSLDGRPDLVVLVLRDLDWLEADDRALLRDLAACKAPGQGLMILTQTAGLASLESTFVETWLGGADAAMDALWLVHDPASAHIRPRPGAGAPVATRVSATGTTFGLPWGTGFGADWNPVPNQTRGPAAPAGRAADPAATDCRLARILLGPRAADTDPATDKAQRVDVDAQTNRLLNPCFRPIQLLAALVLGSTPAAQMRLVKPKGDSDEVWRREAGPYPALLGCGCGDGDAELDGADLEQVLARAEQADGMLLREFADRDREGVRLCLQELFGRAGARLILADALRERAGGRSELLLVRLLACGEHYHLQRVLQGLGRLDWKRHAPPTPARLGAYLEAALFLLEERLALTSAETASPEPLVRLWQGLGDALRQVPLSSQTPGLARLWTLYLAAAARAESHGRGEADGFPDPGRALLDDLLSALDTADAAIGADAEHAWQPGSADARSAFQREAARLQLVVSGLPAELGEPLLEARLSRDWWWLPQAFKSALRERFIRDAGQLLVRALARAGSDRDLLALAGAHAERPLLVLAALTWLALEQNRPRGATAAEPDGPTLAIARFIDAARQRWGEHHERLPRLVPSAPIDEPRLPLAERLAAPAFVEPLFEQLDAGVGRLQRDQRHQKDLGLEDAASAAPEGIALGSRDAVNRVVDELVELALGG